MAYTLKLWEIRDNRTGRVTNVVRGKSRRTVQTRLGRKRASEVTIRQVRE